MKVAGGRKRMLAGRRDKKKHLGPSAVHFATPFDSCLKKVVRERTRRVLI